MGWLVVLAMFLAPLGVGAIYLWLEPSWFRFMVFLGLTLPTAALGWLAYVVLFTEDADPSVGLIALPFVLAGIALIAIWAAAYSRNPKSTMDVTTAAASTYLGVSAVRKYQKMRDQEQAEAVVDEMERRRKDSV